LPPPEDLRGTVYGFFNLRSGIAMLVTSVVAGLLEDRFGAAFTIYVGMVFRVATAAVLAPRPDAARL
jgi:fucose permease